MHTHICESMVTTGRPPPQAHLGNVWVVVLQARRAAVFERLPDRATTWQVRPVEGLDLCLSTDAGLPDETVQSRLVGLLAPLLVLCQSGGRFGRMIVLGDGCRRAWLRCYLNAAAAATITLEADLPAGVSAPPGLGDYLTTLDTDRRPAADPPGLPAGLAAADDRAIRLKGPPFPGEV